MQRQPGIYGVWDDPSPAGDPLPAGGGWPHMPNAHAAMALQPEGLVGVGVPELAHTPPDSVAEAEPEPGRFRYVLFNTRTIKVRITPIWLAQAQMLAMAPGPTPDKDIAAFLDLVRKRRAGVRVEIAETVVPMLEEAGEQNAKNSKDALILKLTRFVERTVPGWVPPDRRG